MDGKRLLHSIRLKNLLSYGSEGVELELEPLNVLIGPNASGKTNLIDAISLLRAAPTNLQSPFREGGAGEDWPWKGANDKEAAQIAVSLKSLSLKPTNRRLFYSLELIFSKTTLIVWGEQLKSDDDTFLSRDAGSAILLPDKKSSSSNQTELDVDPLQSVLSQFRDPANHRNLTYTADQFGRIIVFRGWPFGRDTHLTRPQRADLPDDFLLPDGSNLGMVLNDLQNRTTTKRVIVEKLRQLYDGVEDITTKVQGNTVQIFLHESGLDQPVPAARLSDGTLHYLCLLTILLHPEPPPLVCIEEPELGLHPDVIPKVADLLLDAANRTQLIVTTHSESLVSRLSEVPESVVVCERDNRGTHLRRLDPDKLKIWLDDYSLGDLWAKGEIGGNRW